MKVRKHVPVREYAAVVKECIVSNTTGAGLLEHLSRARESPKNAAQPSRLCLEYHRKSVIR